MKDQALTRATFSKRLTVRRGKPLTAKQEEHLKNSNRAKELAAYLHSKFWTTRMLIILASGETKQYEWESYWTVWAQMKAQEENPHSPAIRNRSAYFSTLIAEHKLQFAKP